VHVCVKQSFGENAQNMRNYPDSLKNFHPLDCRSMRVTIGPLHTDAVEDAPTAWAECDSILVNAHSVFLPESRPRGDYSSAPLP
jgi:hypothetical protein